jgi:Mesyanzhinovviridae DNA polymerase
MKMNSKGMKASMAKPLRNDGQLPLFMPDTNWAAPSALPELTNVSEIALDTENKDDGLATGKGPGWATHAGHICGIGVAWKTEDYHSAYIPITHPDSQNFDKLLVRQWLRDLSRRGTRFIYHNAPYDIGWTSADLGMPVPQKIDDTACMAYMVDETRLNYQLNTLCKWRGLPQKEERVLKEAAAAMQLDPKQELWQLPARYVGDYGQGDALSTLMLAHSLRPQLEEENVLDAYQLEMDIVPMVHAMRQRGICIDYDRCEQLYYQFKADSKNALDDLSDKLSMQVGIDEIRSTAWLEKIFDYHKIDYPRTAKTGKGSFEAKWMKKYDHWLPRLITLAKSREEAAEKFVKGYLMDFCTQDARIHPTINQYRGENLSDDEGGSGGGTRTYRFSYADPPLQQMPHRDPVLVAIRDCFIGEEGEKWLSVDYSQQEYRLMVHYALLRNLRGAQAAAQQYWDNPDTDFHSMVAAMTGLERKPAKDCNFAKAYGAGVIKFASMIGKSQDEAQRIMQQYDQRMPFVKLLYDDCQNTARDRGYIKLIDGARIRFNFWVGSWRPNDGQPYTKADGSADCLYDEAVRRQQDRNHPWFGRQLRRSRCNKAMNALIQGGAARQTKAAMRAVYQAGHTPVLQIHDELCFSVPDDPKVVEEICTLMRDVIPLKVPMKVDAELSESWQEKKED